MANTFSPFVEAYLAGRQPSVQDFLTPGINPAATDYRKQIPSLAQPRPSVSSTPSGAFGKLDQFLGTPGGGFLLNLLAQSGYSPVPDSPFGAIGRAGLMTAQQQRQRNQDDLQKRLIEAKIKLYDQQGTGGGLRPAGLREFEGMTEGLSEDDRELARRIALGLDPRAGISAQERIATNPALSALISNYERQLAEAKEGAKSDVKRKADIEQTNADRAQTLQVWEASRGPLMSALKGTITGPVVGLSPALTAPQQIAEGAIAAVAPVLKQLFRAAGEGIFTDRDQQLLLDMVPKRTDLPETRDAKMAMIDGIIEAKLAPIGAEPLAVEAPESNSASFEEQWKNAKSGDVVGPAPDGTYRRKP